MNYPNHPGSKSTLDTSLAAAEATPANALRDAVKDQLQIADMTADEVAASLNKSILSIRPRLSELRAMVEIEPTAIRRKNDSGHSAVVWRTVKRMQMEML